MIWYLTYPIRKTAKPPVLKPDHPIRAAVEKYANGVAAHPASTILLSITVGLLICFLSFLNHASGSVSGALALPGHMWTSTRVLDHALATPDFTVRQAWIHGRPMSALDPDVLKQALIIQQALLGVEGNTSKAVAWNGSTSTMESVVPSPLRTHPLTGRNLPPASVVHSPLQYWHNSISELEADTDILRTIHLKSSQRSPFNITLRQPSLFAGKSFTTGGKLEAADAAIVSFMYPYGSTEDKWDERANSLARSNRWDVFLPHDGQSIKAYEYKLSTVSRRDDMYLAVAYLVMLARIVFSLRKVQAIRSRYVLLPGIVTQNCLSIMSTFAAMSLLGLDYARIPLEAYVFIVSMVGFDNALRLINAVLEVPAENSTNARVARALGSIAIHMTSPLERVVFLWLLSKVVSPLVAAYCAFIAIAHMFDMFYHLAFFVPILCIDLQRLELQESIARQKPVSSSRSPVSSEDGAPSNDTGGSLAPRRKDKPLSNIRIAGTAVMILFLLALDWQCCSNQTIPRIVQKAISLVQPNSASNVPTDFWSDLMRTVRPSRSLSSWLYLQNQETAEEILHVMKPGARDFEAVVYDPLVIVLKGANRSGAVGKALSPYFSLDNLSFPQLATATLLVAAGIVMAWMALRVWAPSHFRQGFPTNAALKAIAFQEHELDVVLMATSDSGMIVTVSLDREVFVWQLDVTDILTFQHSFMLESKHWPVVAVSISDDSRWAAFCNHKGVISFWSRDLKEFCHSVSVQPPFAQTSKIFALPAGARPHSPLPRMALVRPSGWLSELTARDHEAIHHRVGWGPILSSSKLATPEPEGSILSLSKDRNVYLTSKAGGVWRSRKIQVQKWPSLASTAVSIVTFPGLNAVYGLLSASSKTACLVDAQTHTVIHSLRLLAFIPQTARGLFASSHSCNRCGAVSVASIALAYTDPETKALVMHTIAQSRNSADGVDKICLGGIQDADLPVCPAFDTVEEQVHVIENVASWEQLDSHTLTGLRERTVHKSGNAMSSSRSFEIRQRGRNNISESPISSDDDWEAWMLSIAGQSMSCPIDRSGQRTKLAVSTVGPAQKVGTSSVAVAFGNSVVVLTSSEEDRTVRPGRRTVYQL